jgi:metal-responsive CopG/Arc/MetJ family transcriptional regulator
MTDVRNVKTAISIRAGLFNEAEALAHRLGVPRSQLYAAALEGFLEQHRNRQLLEQINRAYAHPRDRKEQRLLDGMKSHHRNIVKREW